MMVVGKTGMGKSTLLNSLLCPAKYSQTNEDCHFKTDGGSSSVTKNIKQVVGPWLELTEEPEIPLVKVFDTPGLGDTEDLTDAATLEGIIETINSEPVNAILLLLKATDRFSQDIQKQLRTLEYIIGSDQLWDHVIMVFTFWGFSNDDIAKRVRKCVKKRKGDFGGNKRRTRKHCLQVDFEKEKADEVSALLEEYLGVTQRIPYAFPHPVFNYNNEKEKNTFFENAMIIYNHATTMSPLHCDENCQERVKIAKKSETPFVLGPDYLQFQPGEEINLVCNLYLGLGNSEVKEISWWHNSSLLTKEDMDDRKIVVESEIKLDITKESRLIISIATFADSGTYQCSTTEEVNKSPDVNLQVFLRK